MNTKQAYEQFQFHFIPSVADYAQVFNWKPSILRSKALNILKDYESKEYAGMEVRSLVFVDTVPEDYDAPDTVFGVVSTLTKSFGILHILRYAVVPEARHRMMKTLAKYAIMHKMNDISIEIDLSHEHEVKFFLELGMHRNAYDYNLYHFEFRDGIRALADIDTWNTLGNGMLEKEPDCG